MDKNIDENKAEPKILLERYSVCHIPTSGMCKSFCKFKKIDIKKMKSVSDSGQIIDFKSLKCFCKSVLESKETELKNLNKSYKSLMKAKKNDIEKYEFIYQSALEHKKLDVDKWQKIYNETAEAEKLNDMEKYKDVLEDIKEEVYVYVFIKSPEFGDDKWHLDFSGDYGSLFCYDNIGYQSYHVNGANKILCRTDGMKIFFSATCLTPFIGKDIDEVTDSELQIKVLKDAGFCEFTMQLNDKANLTRGMSKENKLKIVDEEGNAVDFGDDEGNVSDCIDEFYKTLDDSFYWALNKNNPNCEYINLAHIDRIFHPIEPDNLHSVIILNKNAEMQYYNDKSPFCKVENGKPLTFYCEPGSKIAIDILSKWMDEEHYPEFYNATIVFMSPKLVADYQKNLDDVDNYREMKEFIKLYKENEEYFSFNLSECSNLRIEQLLFAQKYFSDTWEQFVEFMENIEVKEKSNVEKDVEHANESTDKNDTIGTSDNQNKNKKDIKFINDDKKEKAGIGEVNNKSENESKLEGTKSKSNNGKENTQNINNPAEDLCGFMRYLKKHWPRIFKFINAVCNFFNRSKNDNKIGLENIMNKESKHSLRDKALDSPVQQDIKEKPKTKQSVLQQK